MEADQGDRRSEVPQLSTLPSKKKNIRRKRGFQQPILELGPPPQETVVTTCNRCSKDFIQKKAPERSARGRVGRQMPRLYKLCEHCRETGKSRSRTWQNRTREKGCLCTRCGICLTAEDGAYKLCIKCRAQLRERKLRLALNGKCVQCGIQLASPETETMSVELGMDKVKKRRCPPCNKSSNPSRSSADSKPRPSPFIRELYQ